MSRVHVRFAPILSVVDVARLESVSSDLQIFSAADNHECSRSSAPRTRLLFIIKIGADLISYNAHLAYESAVCAPLALAFSVCLGWASGLRLV